jgi:hypothetical protein
VGEGVAYEIGAHGHQQDQGRGPTPFHSLDRDQQGVQEATTYVLNGAEGIELFELVG